MKPKIRKSRRELQKRMAQVFSGELQMLSAEMQGILVDDLVTAFESRLKVFNRAQAGLREITSMGMVNYETVKA
jgi:hypothetical protein